MDPLESKKNNQICPVCRKPLTVGVQSRVDELADREEGFIPKKPKEFHSLIPLSEILSLVLGKAVGTKTVWTAYDKVMSIGTNEFDILMNVAEETLLEVADRKVVDTILGIRKGNMKVSPGFDGFYGELMIDGKPRVIVPKKSVSPSISDFDKL
jgi:PHP family Zn ribbon phosphoesterase